VLSRAHLIQPVLTKPFHRDGFVYEEKYDGWRMVAYKDGRNVRLVSRRGVDHTERFADIAEAGGYRGLPLGARVGSELRYVGTVEWGVSRALVEALTATVATRAASPFKDHRRGRGVVWLEPRVVAEVTFGELVNGWLRDPVFRQLVLT
jgi:ATP-dependent DNA ligase